MSDTNAIERELFDLIEFARVKRGGLWTHPCGSLAREFAKRISALKSTPAPSPHARGSTAEEIARQAYDDMHEDNSHEENIAVIAAAIRRSAEVTDAEVEAACRAMGCTGNHTFVRSMRNALEAAARARTDSPVADAGDGL